MPDRLILHAELAGISCGKAAIMSRRNPQARVEIVATIEQAFATSRARASLNRKIYVAGRLFTAIEFAVVARGLDPKDLASFQSDIRRVPALTLH